MFIRLNRNSEIRELLNNRLLSRNISNLDIFQQRIQSYYFDRHLVYREDSDDESEENTNSNFMQEKEINYRLYPIYINWKKVEANKEGYYRVFANFGYFGVAIYSAFKEITPNLTADNLLYSTALVVSEYFFSKDVNSESIQKAIKNYFDNIPDLEKILELLKKKILLLKEVPIIFLILKIYEVYFLRNQKYEELKKVLQCMFLIESYITEEEFKEMYSKNFKGKINKIFKTVSSNGKVYKLQKTKQKLLVHIKKIFNKNKENLNPFNNNRNVDN